MHERQPHEPSADALREGLDSPFTPAGTRARRATRSTLVRAAAARLVAALHRLDAHDLAHPSNAMGVTRRDLAVATVGHLDGLARAAETHAAPDASPPPPPQPDDFAHDADGSAFAAAIVAQADRVRSASTAARLETRMRVETPHGQHALTFSQLLDEQLAWLELTHIALDVGYRHDDLSVASVAACRRMRSHRRVRSG